MCSIDRKRVLDTVDILNDFMGDLITGVMVLREYSQELKAGKFSMEQMIPVQKMCVSHLVLTFSKWLEFYDRYHDLVPDKYRDEIKKVNKILNDKKVRQFRSIVIGHLWDKEKKRPLVLSEIMPKLEAIMGPKPRDFLKWVNDPDSNQYPNTIGRCGRKSARYTYESTFNFASGSNREMTYNKRMQSGKLLDTLARRFPKGDARKHYLGFVFRPIQVVGRLQFNNQELQMLS